MVIDLKNIPNVKIEENKRKLEALLRDNRKIIVRAEWPSGYSANQIQALEDCDAQFKSIISKCNTAIEAVNEGFDNIPCANIDFGSIAWLMTLAYGSEMIKINGLINAKPIYFNAADAYSFTKREKVYEYGLYPTITERIHKFQKNYPDIMITIPDNQSPIDVVTCVLHSEEAMIAMFDEPEVIHYLLSIITDSIIEVNRYYESTIANFGGFRAGSFLQEGIHFSDDNAAFLSPSTYHEFARPYIDKLSDEFGKILFHCCLGYSQNLKSMSSVKGFAGFDAATDFNPINKIIDAMSGTAGIWELSNYPWQRNNEREFSDVEMFKKAIDASEGICGMQINVYGSDKTDALRQAESIKNYCLKKGRL